MIIPYAEALEQIKTGTLKGTLLDGLKEIFNIMAGPFARKHIHFTGLHWLPGILPALTPHLHLTRAAKLHAYTVNVEHYGSGKLAFAGTIPR